MITIKAKVLILANILLFRDGAGKSAAYRTALKDAIACIAQLLATSAE